ncbi:MAG: SMI1/KNR4 family protein [Asgard group archaeon]|nr:SMI1/KNR4 family protein [Asgard group archaeon]
MDLPAHFKLFYEQTNGLLIETEYPVNDFENDLPTIEIMKCQDLDYTKKKLNKLPEKRMIRFGDNSEYLDLLLDSKNLDPDENPLIVISNPVEGYVLPLTNSFSALLEAACLGLLEMIDRWMKTKLEDINLPDKMKNKREDILGLLKNFFQTAKREFSLIQVWQVSPKAEKIVQNSIHKWFKIIKVILRKEKKS